MIFDPLFSGLFAGLIIAFSAIGPSFFTLIKLGMQQNFSKGALFASGILLSDLLIVLLVMFGMMQLLDSLFFKQVFSLGGGILVFAFGLNSFKKKYSDKAYHLGKQIPDYQYVIEGFGLNILNPFTFALWFFVIATVNELRSYDSLQMTVFYAMVLITVFGTDLLKTYIANQTGRGIDQHLMRKIQNIIGIVLILFSFRLLSIFLFSVMEAS